MRTLIFLVLIFQVCHGLNLVHEFTQIALRMMTPNGQDFEKTLANFEKLRYNPDQSSYFDLIPQYMGNVEYDALLLENVGNCFKKMTMTRQELENGQLELNINLQDSESLTCAEAMIIATDSQFFVKEFFISGNHKVTFDAVETEAEKWDLFERGPRIFLFKNGLYSALKNLASTLYLFEPCLTEGVGETFAQANLNFLKDNAGIEMPRRPEGVPEILPIDKNLVQNGDTFDIMRLDGLDPMIAWAMGSATGHTAIALWKNEELFLCESNAKSPYWPINGIQCNTYEDWMEYGRKNDYNVVWAPLSRSLDFNATAAWEFVDAHLDIDYGWEIVLMGLLDTQNGNDICMDSEKKNCVVAEHFEMIFSIAQKYSKDAARVFKPAIMQRGQVDFDLNIVEAYFNAYKTKGIEPKELHLIPEEDFWMYPTLRNGENFVSDVSICNVFTCKVLKEAGVFSDLDINCGEFSVNDNYRLKIYEENFERPEICKKWDPENPLCQVLGKYQLRLDSQPGVLPRFNYVQAYSGFGNACPAQAPDYLAPSDC